MSTNLLTFRRLQQESIIFSSLLFSIGFDLDNEEYYISLEKSKMDIITNLSSDLDELSSFINEIEEVKREIDARILDPLCNILIGDLDRYLEILQKKKESSQRRNDSAKRIQRSWRHAISDPTYKVCKNRLLWEFNNYAIKTPCSIV